MAIPIMNPLLWFMILSCTLTYLLHYKPWEMLHAAFTMRELRFYDAIKHTLKTNQSLILLLLQWERGVAK